MKRLHIHLKTDDLEQSVRFYSAMLGSAPTKIEADYAKWLLDDPHANISISTHRGATGFDHAGISLETEEELDALAERLAKAGTITLPEKDTTCCYAKSNKHWVKDPQGMTWELFQTFADSDVYGNEPELAPTETIANTDNCCAPSTSSDNR